MRNININKILAAAIVSLLTVLSLAAFSGCGEAKLADCDCDERLAELETEKSELNEIIETLESQLAEAGN